MTDVTQDGDQDGDGGMDITSTLAQAGLPTVRLAVQAKRVTGGVGPN
jgi:hypothetical protein